MKCTIASALRMDALKYESAKDYVYNMLCEHSGIDIDMPFLKFISTRVAGQVARIKNALPYVHWDLGSRMQILGLFIVTCIEERIGGKTQLFLVRFLSIGGPSSGYVIEKILTPSAMKFIIKQIGGSRYKKYHPEDLYGLTFTAKVTCDKVVHKFEKIWAQPSMADENRKMLKARTGECILKKYSEGCKPCRFGKDVCRLARRAKSLEIGLCKASAITHTHQGYITPTGFCITCMAHKVYMKKKGNPNG